MGNGGVKSIMFAGEGEPLLHPDIADMVNYAKQCSIDSSFTTNGVRLSRSFLGMVNEVSKLIERGVHIKTLDNRLVTTAMPKEITMLLVSILGYAASQELEAIKTRTEEGRAVAKSRGVKFGAKRKYTTQQAATVVEMREQGKGYGTIAQSMGFSIGKVRRILSIEGLI